LQFGHPGCALSGVGAAFEPHAHFDLAPPQPGAQHVAQGRLRAAKLFRQLQHQVQEAAVDRPDFDPQTGQPFGHTVCATVRRGVSGHAVN
jgi:hypothetical protein